MLYPSPHQAKKTTYMDEYHAERCPGHRQQSLDTASGALAGVECILSLRASSRLWSPNYTLRLQGFARIRAQVRGFPYRDSIEHTYVGGGLNNLITTVSNHRTDTCFAARDGKGR